jgi:ABC-2 type transport system ATP-binding protein
MIATAQHLSKSYGGLQAIDDISLTVERGEILGVVGPNGAGKTTFIECLVGLRQPDSGKVSVLDLHPQRQSAALRQRIGVQLQEAALPAQLTVWEALDLFAAFYNRIVNLSQLAARWGLDDKRDTAFENLSGGQKQRLFIALALLNDPEIVFLDELTTGLDPTARRESWALVRQVRDAGKTVVLVTHDMDEAQTLCDRVAIFHDGCVVALDTPTALTAAVERGPCVRFTAPSDFDVSWLSTLPEVEDVRRDEHGGVTVTGHGTLLASVANALAERGHDPPDLRRLQPTLEDAYRYFTQAEETPSCAPGSS